MNPRTEGARRRAKSWVLLALGLLTVALWVGQLASLVPLLIPVIVTVVFAVLLFVTVRRR